MYSSVSNRRGCLGLVFSRKGVLMKGGLCLINCVVKGAVKYNFLLPINGQLCSRIVPSLVFFSFSNIYLQNMMVLLLPEGGPLQS